MPENCLLTYMYITIVFARKKGILTKKVGNCELNRYILKIWKKS